MKALLYSIVLVLSGICCSHLKYPDGIQKVTSIKTTAYTHTESDHTKYGRKSAIGTVLKVGTIATDWSIFPLGTKLRIAGNVYEVSDYGSALIKPASEKPVVDIYTTNRADMNKWGVKFFDDVEIVEFGDYQKSADVLKDRLKYTQCRIMYNRIQAKL